MTTPPPWQPLRPDADTPDPKTPFYRRTWVIAAGAGLLGLFVGSGIGAAGSTDTTTPAAAETRTVEVPGPTLTVDRTIMVTPSRPAAPPPPRPVTFPGDGVYLVPADVKPGTYRSSGTESGNCYWARLRSAGGGLDAIISNGNVAGQVVVTIRSTDKAFESTGCAEWRKVG